jgi:SP family galactose:H+ symporter-like MFS transporter
MPSVIRKDNKSFIYFITVVAALAGLLFGMDTGVIAGALPGIVKDFHLSLGEKGFVVSSLSIGAVLGVILCQPISRYFGRRVGLLISAIIFTLASVFLFFVPSADMLIGIRFVLGLAIGIATFSTPLYLAEISPHRVRGGMIATYQLMVAGGFLLAYISDALLSSSGNWHLMLGVVVIPAVLMLICVLFLPRSPRWLVLNNRVDEARSALSKVLDPEEAETTINEIKDSVAEKTTLMKLLMDKRFLAVVFLGLSMQFFQQATGDNAVNYYVPTIFKLAGFATLKQQMICAVFFGFVHTFMTLVAIKYVDRVGRRPILMLGLSIMALGMAMLAIVVYIGAHNDFLRYTGVLSTFIYTGGYSISVGPVVWVICSEIFPIRIRDVGIMITTMGNWVFNAIVSQSFPTLLHDLTGPGVFLLFVCLSILGVFFVKWVVPETKGISLEEIESNFDNNCSLRNLGVQV